MNKNKGNWTTFAAGNLKPRISFPFPYLIQKMNDTDNNA